MSPMVSDHAERRPRIEPRRSSIQGGSAWLEPSRKALGARRLRALSRSTYDDERTNPRWRDGCSARTTRRRRRPSSTACRPSARSATATGRRPATPAEARPAARLESAADDATASRAAHRRHDRPAHRAVVLRDHDPRTRPAADRLASVLAGHPDRRRPLVSARSGEPAERVTEDLDPGRQIGDRPRLARRLAAPGRRPLRRGPGDGGHRPGHRPRALARGARAALSPAPAVAGPAGERDAFRATHFEHDPSLRFEVTVEPAPPPAPGALALELPNSGADTLSFSRVGRITIPFARASGRCRCSGWPAMRAACSSRSATPRTAPETYGAGRYLIDGAKSADLGGDPAAGTLIVDFNFAFQPSCAFDPQWACPLAPPENRLDIAVRAGERLA